MDACPICCDSLVDGRPTVCLKEKGRKQIFLLPLKISGTLIDVTAKSTVIVNDVHTESIVWIVLSVVESAVELHVPTLLV